MIDFVLAFLHSDVIQVLIKAFEVGPLPIPQMVPKT